MHYLATVFCTFALAATSLGAELSADQAHKQALGKWSQEVEYEGAMYRVVKDIGEEQETVTVYDAQDTVVHQRVVDIKIDVRSGLCIFTYSNGKITAGEGAGDQWGDGAPTSYVFKIHNDKWYEAHQMFVESQDQPSMDTYDRVK